MARTTSVPRTLTLLREAGYCAAVAEKFNAFSGHREDLFGFLDIVALSPGITLGVQVCGTDFSSHVRKLTEERGYFVKKWLENPDRKCLLIGWRKVLKKRGGKQKVYRPRMMEFCLGDDGELTYEEFKGEPDLEDIFGDVQARNKGDE